MKTFVRAYGFFLCGATVLLLILSITCSQKACKPDSCGLYGGGFETPVIALELVRNRDDLRQILSDPECRNQQNRGLYCDSFVFIPLYALFLAGLCVLLLRSRPAAFRKIGVLAAGTGALGVICDYIENHFMWEAIGWGNAGHSAEFTDSMAGHISGPSIAKWLLLFITIALLSVLFIRMGRLGAIIAFCFLASFAIVLYGAINYRPAIESAGLPILPAVILIAYLFLGRTEFVVASLTSGARTN